MVTVTSDTPPPAGKFLVIRRDNIGDLVCTTPLIHALRIAYPKAQLCVLVNSYNRPVVENHPDIDTVYAYTKAKHREPGHPDVTGPTCTRARRARCGSSGA